MTFSQKLIRKLRARFANRGVRVHKGKEPIVSLPARHPEVGSLQIRGDENELTVYVGDLTHYHIYPPLEGPADEKERRLIDHLIANLQEVFEDQIVFWVGDQIEGCCPLALEGETEKTFFPIPDGARRYVWSGPLNPPYGDRREGHVGTPIGGRNMRSSVLTVTVKPAGARAGSSRPPQ
jgi:hypothetical protein